MFPSYSRYPFGPVGFNNGKKELKAWAAIAEYMQSFEDTDKDGIANVPEYYDTTHERKVADNSKNIINLVKHPNKFAVAIVGICIVVVGVILLLIFGIVKIIRRRRCYPSFKQSVA